MQEYSEFTGNASAYELLGGAPGPAGRGAPPLVNRCISERKNHRNPVLLIEVYPRGLRLFHQGQSQAPEFSGKRKEIQSFSEASKRRLRWAASNAFPVLTSQFGMTYHNSFPDGRTVKAHLHRFLVRLQASFPCGYLWILEFQKRGVAHVHLFLTLAQETPGLHDFMARTWNRIAEPGDGAHLSVHLHERNFISWDMGSGAYLCKYLDKAHQKAVPVDFTGVGRFWAASRGLVPPPDVLERFTDADIRIVCKHHEKSLRGFKWKSAARRSRFSYRLPNGATIIRRLEGG